MVAGERHGFALVEMVVTTALLLLVVQASWWVVASQARAAAYVVEAGRAAEARHVTRHLIGSELAFDGGQGAVTVESGEVRLRGFRGIVAFCAGSGAEWWVNVSGLREAVQERDSVLVHDGRLGWLAAALVRRGGGGSGPCPDLLGFQEERWELDRDLEAPVAGRFFERAGYRFSAGAFRTLVGSAWHPVTEASLDDGASSVSPAGGGAVRVSVSWDGPSPLDEPVSWTAWRGR